MPTLDQIAQALKAADAAGNTEDARRLAQAYKQLRDSQQAASSTTEQPAQPQSQPEPSIGQQLGRQFAMAGHSVARGLAAIPGLVNDHIVNTLNYAEDKLGIDPKY